MSRELLLAFDMFADNLLRKTHCAPHILLTSIVYIERFLRATRTDTFVSPEQACKVLVISLILSIKFHSDSAMKNNRWASLLYPWLSEGEINDLERRFLRVIEYNLLISKEDLMDVTNKLVYT